MGCFYFYTPVKDGTYYGMASSVCPRPYGQDTDQTIGARILQLGTFDHHGERKKPIVFQGHRSKVKVIISVNRKTLWTGYRPNYWG